MDNSAKASISDLPEEILEHIIQFLSPYRDLKTSCLVCKCWYYITMGVARKKADSFKKAVSSGQLNWHLFQKDLGPSITERYSHSAVYHNKSVFVFGGCTATNTTFNDLWTFDLCLNQWIRPLASGSYPSPKACATLVTYEERLILFGGWSHPSPYPLHQASRYFNQVHIYCPNTKRWNNAASTNSPHGRAGHSANIIGHTMLVFGGAQQDVHSCNELWILDLKDMNWKKQDVSGKKPLPRYGHGMFVLDEQHLLLVGGCGGQNMKLTDVWVLDMTGDSWVWREITVEGTDFIPPQLWFHPLCKVGDRIVVVSDVSHLPAPLDSSNQPRPTKHSLLTTQLAQMRRNLPDTSASESSSQESSSDTDDASHGAGGASAVGGDVRPRLPARNSAASFASRHSDQSKPCIKSHTCNKCGNHWDTCLCTDGSYNALPRNSQFSNSNTLAGISASRAGGSTSGAGTSTSAAGTSISEPRACIPAVGSSGASPGSSEQPESLVNRRSARGMPSIRPNASRNRQKQLETLRKYEEKFKIQTNNEDIEMKVQGNVIEVVDNSRKKAQRPMYVHVLDISKVLQQGTVTWQPVKSHSCINAPDETIFYSLVEGRGELVMFGGIEVNTKTMQLIAANDLQTVSNNVYFLRPANVLL